MRIRVLVIAASCTVCAVNPVARADQWCLAPTSIPDGGTASTTVTVPATADVRTITAVRVHIAATHPWTGDLAFRLRHPSGFEVVLLDRPGVPSVGYPGPWGCGGDNIDAWFDDAALDAAESWCPFGSSPALSGSLRPGTALAALIGRAPQGMWTLLASDAVAGDAGSIGFACIEISTAPDCNANGVPDAQDIQSGSSADADADGVPDECACVGDIDHSGAVDAADLARLLGSWGGCVGCSDDLTGDGQVLGDDLAVLLSSWGACGPD